MQLLEAEWLVLKTSRVTTLRMADCLASTCGWLSWDWCKVSSVVRNSWWASGRAVHGHYEMLLLLAMEKWTGTDCAIAELWAVVRPVSEPNGIVWKWCKLPQKGKRNSGSQSNFYLINCCGARLQHWKSTIWRRWICTIVPYFTARDWGWWKVTLIICKVVPESATIIQKGL